MCRLYILLLAAVLVTLPAHARARQSGYCQTGAQTAKITGMAYTITPKVQGSFPGCTVAVYQSGTTTPATIYADNSGTTRANPFTADASGFWYFYADNGHYDVMLSGGGLPSPVTLGDVGAMDPSGATIGIAASDYASLTAAINTVCASGGGTVTIPAQITITLSNSTTTNGAFGYLPYCSNLTVQGADKQTSVIKIADGQQSITRDPMIWYIPNTSFTALSNFRLSNLTVDWNGQNNPVPQTATNKLNGVLWVKYASDVWVDGVTLLNHPGHQPFAFGSNTNPQTASRIHFLNNYIHNVSDAVAGNVYATDHSSIYCQCDYSEILNNTVYNDTKAAHATAYELHMRYGRVIGNGAYNIDAGANVVATVTDQRDMIYEGNTFYNVDYGFRLWTGTGMTMQDVRFVANDITLAATTAVFGGIYGATELVTAPLNIEISQNTIHTLSGFAGNGKTNPGISFSKGTDISIRGNRIHDMSGRGIELFGVERASVDNNDIYDIGQGGNTSYQDAIAVLTASQLTRFAASDNRVYQISATTTANGINVLGPITTVYLTDNTLNPQVSEVLSSSWTGTTFVNDSARFYYRQLKADSSGIWLYWCGNTTDQVCRIALGGRTATNYWGLDKASDNTFQLFDIQNNKIRMRAAQLGQTEVNSDSNSVVSFNTRTGSGTGGVNGGNGAGAETWHVTGPGQPQFPLIKASSGTRYVCVDTSGNLVSSVTACSGT